MTYRGAIFDVDGVLVDSPHELAWRESFRRLMETEWREVRDQTVELASGGRHEFALERRP